MKFEENKSDPLIHRWVLSNNSFVTEIVYYPSPSRHVKLRTVSTRDSDKFLKNQDIWRKICEEHGVQFAAETGHNNNWSAEQLKNLGGQTRLPPHFVRGSKYLSKASLKAVRKYPLAIFY